MAATDFRDDTVQTTTSGTSLTLTKPTGTVEFDLLEAVLHFATTVTVTEPAGWALRESATSSGGIVTQIWELVAGGSEPADYTWSFSSTVIFSAWLGCYVDAVFDVDLGQLLTPAGTPSTSLPCPSITATRTGRVICVGSHAFDTNPGYTEPGGTSPRQVASGFSMAVVDAAITPGATGVKTIAAGFGVSNRWAYSLAIRPRNVAPNAPIPITPVGGVSVDVDSPQVLRTQFSDDDAGDSQSAIAFRYRVVGAGSWTSTGQLVTPNPQITIAAGTFTEDDYEWQARTWDAQGEVGPFSASSFFTGAAVPTDLSITAPTNGSTIPTSTVLVEWSTPDQESYEARVVADDGLGAPDTAVVYFTTLEVVSSSTRSLVVPLPTNNVDRHIQVRIKNSGLWSDWVSVFVSVAYTPPATPTASVSIWQDADGRDAAFLLEVTNP